MASVAGATLPSAVVSSAGRIPLAVVVPPAEAGPGSEADSSAIRIPGPAAASNAGVTPASAATIRGAGPAPAVTPVPAAGSIAATPAMGSTVAVTIPVIEAMPGVVSPASAVDSTVAVTIPVTGAMPGVVSPASAVDSSVVVIPTSVVTRGGAVTPVSSAAKAIAGIRDRIARIARRAATRRRTVAEAAKGPVPVGTVPWNAARRVRRNPICLRKCRRPISTPSCGGTC
ncbi:hypothetical protein IU470_29455 [Nocardia abscessus]|uniref:Uncharacterized protein n=1 Tax=Nocardia abscessus TaxID=120957 RepID=A0ABS0CH46_9NOCA|nr:hypothetical protein [Nocardia abscessus]MBF6229205.1 hypothetical protein [Nocardia abscessus]